jgi:hypothetical protein
MRATEDSLEDMLVSTTHVKLILKALRAFDASQQQTLVSSQNANDSSEDETPAPRKKQGNYSSEPFLFNEVIK